MSGELRIHILGKGFGESIILELPNGKVGLFDCYSSSLKVDANTSAARISANPILRFLTDQLHVDSLAFVGFSHPHEDHGRGMSHVLNHFKDRIEEIWLFHGWDQIHIERYCEALLKSGRKLPIEELLDQPPGIFAEELLDTIELVLDQVSPPSRPNAAFLRGFANYQRVILQGEPSVIFHFLGPSQAYAAGYLNRLRQNIEGIFQGNGATIDPTWEPSSVNHNDASPALLIEFGDSRIILGGDMEESAWEQVLKEQGGFAGDRPSLECHLVKVSHHGSETGYTADLYESFSCKSTKPIGVLTPFTRCKSPLPSRIGVSFLETKVSRLISTNRKAALRSLGFPTEESVALPRDWVDMISTNPALAGVLKPGLMETVGVVDDAYSVPPEWIPEIEHNRSLVTLLREDLQQGLCLPEDNDTENACRVSFTLDNKGNVNCSYVGTESGELPSVASV